MTDFYDCGQLLDRAQQKNCPTVIIVGGKGNGKTFSILAKYIDEYLRTGKVLRYLRRYKESITPKALQSLLLPQYKNITISSGGKYNSYVYYRNRFYLAKKDNEGNVIKKDKNPCIICNALNSVEGFTGADEGQCSAIFFDEFISRERELPDEFASLMIYHNNCIRNRTDEYTPLILVGNTMSRNSTLAKDFGVNLYNLTKGSVYEYYNKSNDILCICEYCDTTDKMRKAGNKIYSRYNDSKVRMIYTGDWSIANYPRIKNRYLDNSDIIFTFALKANKMLNVEIRVYNSYIFAYVTVRDESDKYDILVTTDVTPLHIDIYNYYANVPVFNKLKSLILQNQVFFRDGECGEMFRDFMTNLRGADFVRSCYH